MTDVVSKSFKLNLFVMKMLFLYEPGKHTIFYNIFKWIFFILTIVTVPVLSILHLVLDENLDMERVNYNAAFQVQVVCFITKFLPFVINNNRLKKCLNYLEEFVLNKTRNDQQKIVDNCVNICRRNSMGFLVCSIFAVVSWAAKPLFLKDRLYPVDIWLPFESTKEALIYCLIYLFVAIGPIVASLLTGVLDPLIAGLAYHATTQLKLLKNNLQCLEEHASETVSEQIVDLKEEMKQQLIFESIKKCIDHYDEILRFVKDYEKCFSWVVFSQIAASVFLLGFSCLQLSKVEAFGYYAFQLVTYFIIILGEIYFYCFYGSTLSEENYSLTSAIYSGKWYNYDMRSKKALIIIIERSKVPLTITAGHIIDLSLDTFTTILRRSYSLLAVLKNYQ